MKLIPLFRKVYPSVQRWHTINTAHKVNIVCVQDFLMSRKLQFSAPLYVFLAFLCVQFCSKENTYVCLGFQMMHVHPLVFFIALSVLGPAQADDSCRATAGEQILSFRTLKGHAKMRSVLFDLTNGNLVRARSHSRRLHLGTYRGLRRQLHLHHDFAG